MATCFYRLSNTQDPEERLEDAVLSKALYDVLGARLAILGPEESYPAGGLHLGRDRHIPTPRPLSASIIRYWEDPAFLSHISRRMTHCTLKEAGAAVRDIHNDGRDAFIKATHQAKLLTKAVPLGVSLAQALDAMVYSFIDRPPCLLVQEGVRMRYERRYIVMNGQIMTQSPIATHLTPMSRLWEAEPGQDFEDLHYLTPRSRSPIHDPDLTRRMNAVALNIASSSEYENFCMDLCVLGEDRNKGRIEPVEWNPMQPGMLGLFGCDPIRIALGVADYLDRNPDLGRSGPDAKAPEVEEIYKDFDP